MWREQRRLRSQLREYEEELRKSRAEQVAITNKQHHINETQRNIIENLQHLNTQQDRFIAFMERAAQRNATPTPSGSTTSGSTTSTNSGSTTSTNSDDSEGGGASMAKVSWCLETSRWIACFSINFSYCIILHIICRERTPRRGRERPGARRPLQELHQYHPPQQHRPLRQTHRQVAIIMGIIKCRAPGSVCMCLVRPCAPYGRWEIRLHDAGYVTRTHLYNNLSPGRGWGRAY